MRSGILLIDCPDRPGLVAAIAMAATLVQKGRDLGRVVLSRAVRWRLERRILFYGNKTVVFD